MSVTVPTTGSKLVWTSQPEVGGAGIDTTDILHILGPTGAVTAWIDYTGAGGGNLASGGSSLGTFSSAELVSASGTTFGPLAHAPNGNFFQLSKNGQLLQPGAGNDFVLSGSSGTLDVAAQSEDVYLAWYTH